MAEYLAYRDGGKTNEEGLFKFLSRLFSKGHGTVNLTTSHAVTQRGAGANMSVDIAAGESHIPYSTYSFFGWSDAVNNQTVSAADPTNPRKDIVVAFVDLSVVSSASNNNPNAYKLKVVPGTAAASPVDPLDATIQSSVGGSNPWIKLARIDVAAGATSIVTGNVTDLRAPVAFKGRLWGGTSNTIGHAVPNAADDTVALLAAAQALTNKTFDTQLNTLTNQGYQILGRTSLGSAGDTISVSGLSAKKYLRVIFMCLNSGSVNSVMRFNGDTASNYAYRQSINGAADTTASAQTFIGLQAATGSFPLYSVVDIVNIATQEKYVSGLSFATVAGAANAPSRGEAAGKWANTSNAITQVDVVNTSTGDYAIGSEVIVLGHD